MEAKLERVRVLVEPNIALESFAENPHGWLTDQAKQFGFQFLLAHAKDAVVWGKFTGNTLQLVENEFPALHSLVDARAFGAKGEMFLWKDGNVWRARRIQDDVGDERMSFVERYWLWGTPETDNVQTTEGFTPLVEGLQGFRHTLPLTGLGAKQRAALVVRHYVAHDAEGQAYVEFSRLVKLEPVKGDQDGLVSK